MLSILLGAAIKAQRPIVVDGVLCHPSRLIVKLADIGETSSLTRAGLRVLETYPQIRCAVVETVDGSVKEARSQLEGQPGIERVEYDRAARAAYTPNDAMWPDMWHARTLKVDLAWDLTRGSSNVIVAVIDTGVNTAHPDLAGNIWVNSGEIPNNGIDDDANGYIDDRNGYDFGYNDPIPNDVNGHGTSCAGLVAAVQDNTIGVTGTAPFAKIMALKASTDDGYFYDSANIGCYMYAAGNGAKVLSCSYFSDRVSQAERDAIDYCWQRGILPVVAAGNANTITPYYPGAYENVLAVGATDQSDNKAGFSNYGSWVDVASPGVSLRSTTAGGGYTNGFGGTSGATPQVAGIAALILGARPNLTNAQLRSILEDTATALATDWTNYGLVNAQKAVRVALGLETQVAKTPVARYITPIVYGNRIGGGIRGNEVARLYGRGFQTPNAVEIKVGTTNLRILRQTRDWIDFELPIGSAPIEVSVNGSKLRTFTRPAVSPTAWSAIELASPGAGTTGGFDETLRADNVNATCTRRSDGVIRLDTVFRRVVSFGNPMRLTLKRHFTGSTVGTEKVWIYNWSTASYPYGSWTQLSSRGLPQTSTTSTLTVSEPWKYIDPEGTVYLRVETSNDVASGAVLNLDQCVLLSR